MAFGGMNTLQDRYGREAVKHAAGGEMLNAEGAGRSGNGMRRVASWQPWTALYWLVSGRTVGGMKMHDDNNRLDRDTALESYGLSAARFSDEQGKKRAD